MAKTQSQVLYRRTEWQINRLRIGSLRVLFLSSVLSARLAWFTVECSKKASCVASLTCALGPGVFHDFGTTPVQSILLILILRIPLVRGTKKDISDTAKKQVIHLYYNHRREKADIAGDLQRYLSSVEKILGGYRRNLEGTASEVYGGRSSGPDGRTRTVHPSCCRLNRTPGSDSAFTSQRIFLNASERVQTPNAHVFFLAENMVFSAESIMVERSEYLFKLRPEITCPKVSADLFIGSNGHGNGPPVALPSSL
ncbi:hypothetical protein DFH09DRAFT_1085930 [Mycena vulgaris]|nr:hypothetical protein DFH09DRAFT_1085930 [Mycena vulgaris]